MVNNRESLNLRFRTKRTDSQEIAVGIIPHVNWPFCNYMVSRGRRRCDHVGGRDGGGDGGSGDVGVGVVVGGGGVGGGGGGGGDV
ncbi:unnamed protein product [Didymodactylos carnosus]|uniref:Uncharacterized protein n=1 Tax=Didymodactylos carnosus TaxID=1234261 RepID=A0A813WX70_9BILA|nr:unnamed protein product [Didymodactylos carnosus]CAF1161098.1 unnamed protein product [Didymodactylos carnosus]CAF3644533.1 unnamed protein product [Didymodactylos carnosus]CAF3972835.1 unnamed protein product [Didymodactylos carnosus]